MANYTLEHTMACCIYFVQWNPVFCVWAVTLIVIIRLCIILVWIRLSLSFALVLFIVVLSVDEVKMTTTIQLKYLLPHDSHDRREKKTRTHNTNNILESKHCILVISFVINLCSIPKRTRLYTQLSIPYIFFFFEINSCNEDSNPFFLYLGRLYTQMRCPYRLCAFEYITNNIHV